VTVAIATLHVERCKVCIASQLALTMKHSDCNLC